MSSSSTSICDHQSLLGPPCKLRKSGLDGNSEASGISLKKCDDETLDTLRVLMIMGANMNLEDNDGFTPLFRAVDRNDIPMIRALVSIGADVNYNSPASNSCRGGSALHLAAIQSDLETVNVLLDLGAQVNLPDPSGKTPLHYAAWSGRMNSLMALVARGGDIHAKDFYGLTLLHMAAEAGQAEIVRWLLEKGTDPRVQTREGITPLHDAAIGGHIRIIELLLMYMKPDCKDILGRTPLMCAVRYGKVGAAKRLLKAGAMTNWSAIDLVKAEIALNWSSAELESE